MKLKRAVLACVLLSGLLLCGVLVAYLSVPRNAVTAAAVIRRRWPDSTQSSALVSALLDTAEKPGVLDTNSSSLEIRHQLQLQQYAFCLRGLHETPLPGTVGVQFGECDSALMCSLPPHS
jgi:hypothetical protein